MKVLGITGSPRKRGNTAALVDRILRGAAEKGADTELICLDEIDLNPCLACDACKKTSRCIQPDGMQAVYDAIDASRALVLGSPVYFDQVSAQTKMFIDRLYCYCDTQQGPKNFPPGYRGVVAITYEDRNPTRYDFVLEWMKERLEHYHEIQVTAMFKAAATGDFPVERDRTLLERAYREGGLLAEYLASL